MEKAQSKWKNIDCQASKTANQFSIYPFTDPQLRYSGFQGLGFRITDSQYLVLWMHGCKEALDVLEELTLVIGYICLSPDRAIFIFEYFVFAPIPGKVSVMYDVTFMGRAFIRQMHLSFKHG